MKVDDIIETINHFACVHLLVEQITAPLSQELIKRLHKTMYYGTYADRKNDVRPGEYRKEFKKRGVQPGFIRQELAALIAEYDIEEFLKKLRREGASNSRLTACRGMLFQIFHKAEANDLVHKNPVRFAEKMRSKDPVTARECFTAEEVKLLMANLSYDRIGVSIRLMLGTGMRSQEILALEPKHIAEDGSVIQIRQAINMVKGTAVVGTPKSRDSYRDVLVPPSLRSCAIALRSTDDVYVWESGIRGKPGNPSHFRNQYKKALEAIEGVRYLSPHSCRHTYVSQMQALGVDLATIQSIVGHADMDMTKHYLHVHDPIRQAAVEKFSEAFGN